MAVNGYIINTDMTPVKKMYEEVHKIGVNVNQIAKKVNGNGELLLYLSIFVNFLFFQLYLKKLYFLSCF